MENGEMIRDFNTDHGDKKHWKESKETTWKI